MTERRRSIRLQAYDYASPGAYFVTVSASQRELLFDDPAFAAVLEEAWRALSEHFAHVGADEFVVMPNRIHGILWLTDDRQVGARHASPLRGKRRRGSRGAPPGSLGAIVGSFKSVCTRRINRLRDTPEAPVWQRNYYERVIRNEEELLRVREYVRLNPLKWQLDRENPNRLTDSSYEREWAWLEGSAPAARGAASR